MKCVCLSKMWKRDDAQGKVAALEMRVEGGGSTWARAGQTQLGRAFDKAGDRLMHC